MAFKILHFYKVYPPDSRGGVATVISSLTRNPPNDISHAVLTARGFGWRRKFTTDGLPIEAVSSFGSFFSMPMAAGYIPAAVQRMRNADLAIHHAPFPLTDLAALLGLPADVPLIIYWHADIIGYPLLKRLISPLIARALARADKLVVSGAAIIAGSDLLKPYASKCVIIPYGIDLEYWRSLDTEDAVEIAEMKRLQPRHIVALGRLVRYKGFDVLIRAMRHVDARTTIVGSGPQQNALKQLAMNLGVADRIQFVGQLSPHEIKLLFHSSNVFAFPSVNAAEAYGLAQAEAMATGLPIVNTNILTTVPWVARHNQEALTVPPNDPIALASALNAILDQPDLAKRLGASAFDRATNEFAEETFRARMDEVYRQALRAREIRT
jgi:glycosyltransferase involved in cell wall biosynthesis